MNNFQKIINSFSLQDSLNPKVWENPTEPSESKMVPKVRMALEKIAEKFINYLGDDVFVEDVVLMGSLANYNWSEFSDFDLHIIIDFQQYEKEAELFKELFDLKKKDFNSNHDIRIFGYDVELYAQGSDEPNASTAVYSIMNDEWLKVPQKEDLKIDLDYLKTKIKCWTQKIDDAIQDKDLDKLSNLKEKIKKYRQSGLEKEGEFSYENLVFKFLRRSGHIEDLFDTINKVEDKELSVENKLDS
jgi:predicted nucleotidyltransferase